ncbi:MAG: M20/M25/M40 family metallo-hydrolase [Candidatus Bathyarchaeota archaeon]|nr:MAG: M20/M25/M40 family metallo-hydrolase [Candidatus Bathyarchaeota archaeon]
MMQSKRQVFDYIEECQDDMVELLCRLIESKPVNPGVPGQGAEKAAQEVVEKTFRDYGFPQVDVWAADPSASRPNVVGSLLGKGDGQNLIYNGHIDVVPVPESQLSQWTVEPWTPTIQDGRIYGRGASDMLGGIVAMIWSAKALLDNDIALQGTLHVESVVGEESVEGKTIGTASTIDRGYTAPFAVIADTSNCEIQTITCGTFIFEMIVVGKAIHTCMKNLTMYPQRFGIPQGSDVGVDAITKSMRYLDAFEQMEKNWNLRWRHPILGAGGYPIPNDTQGVGIFSITPTLIEGGQFVAALAGSCKVTCQVYYPSWVEANEVWSEVKRVIASVSLTDDWLKDHPPQLKIDQSIEGKEPFIPPWGSSEIPVDHPGCQMLAGSWREATSTDAVFSGLKAVDDAAWFTARGIPAATLGPGDLSMGAHGSDEYVPILHLLRCCKTYAAMAINWCGID